MIQVDIVSSMEIRLIETCAAFVIAAASVGCISLGIVGKELAFVVGIIVVEEDWMVEVDYIEVDCIAVAVAHTAAV